MFKRFSARMADTAQADSLEALSGGVANLTNGTAEILDSTASPVAERWHALNQRLLAYAKRAVEAGRANPARLASLGVLAGVAMVLLLRRSK